MAKLTRSRNRKTRKPDRWSFETEHPALARRFIVLTGQFHLVDIPINPLTIPSGWSRSIDGDFSFADFDLCIRELAIGRAITDNRAAMSNYENDDQQSDWSLVFEIGEVEDGSFLNVEGGCCATITIDTTLTLVHPTPEEIAHARKEKVGAA
jgi:hypothetical protein